MGETLLDEFSSGGVPGADQACEERARFRVEDVTDVLWTLTEKCNLRCPYCCVTTRPGQRREPLRSQVDAIADQLERLPGLESLIISGGEALVSPHVEHVLQRARRIAPTCYLITNGTMLRPRDKDVLSGFRPRVMITVDSIEDEENSRTRGEGTLQSSLSTLTWLLENDIFTIVIMVLNRENARGIGRTISALYDRGVRRFLVQQLHCTSVAMRKRFHELLPTHAEVEAVNDFVESFRVSHTDALIDDNEACFFHRRPRELELRCEPGVEYLPQRLFMCGAGFEFLAIRPHGEVLPCNAFLDTPVGNVLSEPIDEILKKSPVMRGLRALRSHRVNEIDACSSCDFQPICDWGCRADVYNLSGEIGDPHPACPWARP